MVRKTLKTPSNRKIFLSVAVICAFLWSWLFLVDAGKLSSQIIVGYLTISVVYALIVSISSAIFTLTIIYLKKSYKQNPDYKWILKAIFVWALAEAAVAWIVAIIWMGRNGSIDNILPFSTFTPFLVSKCKPLAPFCGEVIDVLGDADGVANMVACFPIITNGLAISLCEDGAVALLFTEDDSLLIVAEVALVNMFTVSLA